MEIQKITNYFCFGTSLVIVLLESVFSGHLWKPRISRRFLYLSFVIAASGAVLEATKYLNHATGMTIVVMGIPLYYLANFQLFRLIFKKYYQTEPFVVSAGSVIGSPPLDLFTSENKDGKNRKFKKGREILAADFAFSLAANLVPAFVIYCALYLIREFNK